MSRIIADTYDRIVFILLIFQYAFVNVAFGVWTQNIVMIKDLSAPFFSLVILSVWIVGDLAKYGRWQLPKQGIVPATVITLLVWVMSTFQSTFIEAALEEWGRMFTYFIQVWALIRFANTIERIETIMVWVLITNILLVGYGLSQLMNNDILVAMGFIPDWGPNVYVSTHGNSNFFAGYLDTTYQLLVGYWLVTRNPVLLLGLPFLIALNLYEIVASDARAAYISTAVTLSLLVLGLVVNFRNLRLFEEKWRKYVMQAAAVCMVVGLAVGFVVKREKVMAVPKRIVAQFESLGSLDKHFTNRARLIFWQMAVDGGRRSPWLGRGLGTFNYHMPEMRPPWYHRTGVTHNTDHAHQEYLEWFMDTGLVGLTSFLWVLAVFFITGIRELWRLRKSYHYPLLLTAILSPLGLWIQCAFDVESRWTGNAVTLWFGAGLALAFCNIKAPAAAAAVDPVATLKAIQPQAQKRRVRAARGPEYNPSPYLPWAAALCALVVSFYTVKAYDIWMSDYWLRMNMAYTDANQGTPQQALAAAEKARDLNYSEVSVYYKLAYTHLVSGQLDKALASYRRLQDFAPNYAQIHINLAYLKDQMGYRAASAMERERAATIEHNARNHRDAAMYWMQLGYPNRALPHLRQCFTVERDRVDNAYYWWYDHDNIHLDLAQVYQNQGRRDDAVLEVRRALEQNPDNLKAAVDLVMLLKEVGRADEVKAVAERIRAHDASSAQALFVTALENVDRKEYDKALTLLDAMSQKMQLPPPGQTQPAQEVQAIGNASLQILQKIFEANYDRARCYELAGWIYACQARYSESEQFLRQALGAAPNERLINLLGMIRARLGR